MIALMCEVVRQMIVAMAAAMVMVMVMKQDWDQDDKGDVDC